MSQHATTVSADDTLFASPESTPGEFAAESPGVHARATERRPMQARRIAFSPYHGVPDLSVIPNASGRLHADFVDKVSLADILRNGFAYPPYSIRRDVQLQVHALDQGVTAIEPEFRFEHAREPARARTVADGNGDALVEQYHCLLGGAIKRASASMRSPWLLQSGGKDSTSMAIAAADFRPDLSCITYLGGTEENEVESARTVARALGLRHEFLVCDVERAYDRYLALVGKMPLLNADFAILSYADLVTEVAGLGGDGILDGVGPDAYFGTVTGPRDKLLQMLSTQLRLPSALSRLPWLGNSFRATYLLSTLQMHPVERFFPGSRFSDNEVDHLLGSSISKASKQRLRHFLKAMQSAPTLDERRAVSLTISDPAASFAKGIMIADAAGMQIGFPFCDAPLREWVRTELPDHLLKDTAAHLNKVVVRKHIHRRFDQLPYVSSKGSFRFDLRALARKRFDQVHAFAERTRALVPGATRWLETHRNRLDNKTHASRFHLLAVTLPWLDTHVQVAE